MSQLVVTTLPDFPLVRAGDDLAALIGAALDRAALTLRAHDVIVVTSKIVSKAEGRAVRLSEVTPGAGARDLAAETGKDAREVELMLRESTRVVRARPGLILTRHRLGFVSANAGIDHSNVAEGADEYVLLLPADPDATAERLRAALARMGGANIAVVIADSHGRPHRLGTVGVAIGSAGLPALEDWRGRRDLFGYELRYTDIGLADMLASAATLLFGQAHEGTPVAHIRGAAWQGASGAARDLIRPVDMDLFP